MLMAVFEGRAPERRPQSPTEVAAARGRLWVRVLLLLCTHFCGPVLLTFCQVEEAHEVDLDGTSSPTSRGCRVLEVVPPYLWAVYSNGLVARHARSSSERCPQSTSLHGAVRCCECRRERALRGSYGAAARVAWVKGGA